MSEHHDPRMHNYKRIPLRFTHGERCTLFDEDGQGYIDFASGIGVNSLGHAHPKLTAVLQDQVAKLLHVSNLYDEPLQIDCAARIAKACGLDQVFFCNSGTEASEAAIKLARRVQHDRGHTGKTGILCVEGGFHGRTLGALSCTANEAYRATFEPLVPGMQWIPRDDVEALERELRSGSYAGFFVEPIQGEAGVLPLAAEFLRRARQLCTETETVFIADEVQAGGGRTGQFLACQHYDIEPDLVTLAKPLAGGVPIGALVGRRPFSEHFVPGDHGSTFGGNPLACRAALTVLSELFDQGLLEHVHEVSRDFERRLEQLVDSFDPVQSQRGVGLMRALVLDEQLSNADVTASLRERGLLVIPSPGNSLRMLPPFVLGSDELDCAFDILDSEFATHS
jgi:acetylornithine/N-succinyldiaminopimelate aminotransferase